MEMGACCGIFFYAVLFVGLIFVFKLKVDFALAYENGHIMLSLIFCKDTVSAKTVE